MGKIYLIIHADDFGLSPGINKGILHTILQGAVSSVSVMVDTPYRQTTALCIKRHPQIDWGLHVVPGTYGMTEYTIVNETERQIRLFRDLFNRFPSHIDFHKGFRFNSKMYFLMRMLTLKKGVAFRYDNSHTIISSFYGLKRNQKTHEDIRLPALTRILTSLRPGFTELICHPGWTNSHLTDPYRTERNIEADTLTNPLVKQTLAERKIHLISYSEYNILQKELRNGTQTR